MPPTAPTAPDPDPGRRKARCPGCHALVPLDRAGCYATHWPPWAVQGGRLIPCRMSGARFAAGDVLAATPAAGRTDG